MGLFQQREEDENTWAVLPGEPRDAKDAAGTLEVAAPIDPFGIDLGAQVTSIVFPVAPVLEDGASTENREPDADVDDAAE